MTKKSMNFHTDNHCWKINCWLVIVHGKCCPISVCTANLMRLHWQRLVLLGIYFFLKRQNPSRQRRSSRYSFWNAMLTSKISQSSSALMTNVKRCALPWWIQFQWKTDWNPITGLASCCMSMLHRWKGCILRWLITLPCHDKLNVTNHRVIPLKDGYVVRLTLLVDNEPVKSLNWPYGVLRPSSIIRMSLNYCPLSEDQNSIKLPSFIGLLNVWKILSSHIDRKFAKILTHTTVCSDTNVFRQTPGPRHCSKLGGVQSKAPQRQANSSSRLICDISDSWKPGNGSKIIWTLLCGKSPFKTVELSRLTHRLDCHMLREMSFWSQGEGQGWCLILLCPSPKRRPSG